jgi:maleylpyruvate isomerase
MYPSAAARNADIEAGTSRLPDELRAWFDESSARLNASMSTLTEEQWQAQVRTAQGAAIPATKIPWMRSREVLIHAVDLGTGITFADLPTDFLEALCQDIQSQRGAVPEVEGPLPELAAYLSGRPYADVVTPDGTPANPLPPWL